jgi:ABC-type microcin C transport system permease subunit YejE
MNFEQVEQIRIGVDILAIPFFFLLIIYLYQQPNNILRNLMLLFAWSGFLIDTWLTLKRYCV